MFNVCRFLYLLPVIRPLKEEKLYQIDIIKEENLEIDYCTSYDLLNCSGYIHQLASNQIRFRMKTSM